ncbi:MAG TPA: SDR family oxidoreductase [Candidatus Bacteroides pullicola]|uniref:SDR family oxidoreductase n=1 Tax=Candidatus Bacteroides pullicola TaxID=2838475 RepID=A0A9D1ZJB5_9BACE|nr:SDR family oxidoreductase [Candidatus Bacteroides pullicola]
MARRVFVTGGAHGIGRSIVETFRKVGDEVAFCDIDSLRGKDVAEETGAVFHHADVADREQLEHCLQTVVEQWGDLDILVNNAGTSAFSPIAETSVEEFDWIIRTNLRPAFITSRFLARHRLQNGNTAYGRIVNLCSTRYLMSEAGTEGYSASKGGIFSLTHALAISLAPLRITVNAVAPGWIHVNEEETLRPIDHKFHPSGRVGTPEDIARAILFLCDEKNDFINGQTLTVDGGVTRKMIYPE